MFKEGFSPHIAIAAGFGLEVPPLRELIAGSLQGPQKGEANKNLYHGKLDGMDIVLFVSGMGMRRARQTTREVLEKYPSITYVIDIGMAGSISAAKPPDVVVPQQWADYSWTIGQNPLDLVLCGRDFGETFSRPIEVNDRLLNVTESLSSVTGSVVLGGLGLSSSKILIREEHKLLLQDQYPNAHIVDMESYAVIQACQQRDHPIAAIAIRAVSDMAGRGYREFLRNFSAAKKSNIEAVKDNYTAFVGALIRKLA